MSTVLQVDVPVGEGLGAPNDQKALVSVIFGSANDEGEGSPQRHGAARVVGRRRTRVKQGPLVSQYFASVPLFPHRILVKFWKRANIHSLGKS